MEVLQFNDFLARVVWLDNLMIRSLVYFFRTEYSLARQALRRAAKIIEQRGLGESISVARLISALAIQS